MTVRDQLKERRSKISEQYVWFQIAALTYTIIFLILGGIAVAMLVLLNPASPWHIPEPSDELGDQIAIWVLSISGGLSLFGFMPLLISVYHERFERTRDLLVNGTMAGLLIDPVFWEPVVSQAGNSNWLASTGLRHPETLLEQIDLAADYHEYIAARATNSPKDPHRLIQQGNRSRLADNLAGFTFNMSCTGIGCMTFGAPLLILLFPVSFWLIFSYARQRASQAAMLEFFIRGTSRKPT